MAYYRMTDAEAQQFHEDGYLLVRMFDDEEIELLRQACANDPALDTHSIQLSDGDGGKSDITLWNNPADDLYGAFSRCERLVGSMERLLGGEVYHYHSKIVNKKPRTGGAWVWHQDYGYWYQNGCLFPHMASCLIAVDPATRENGCLQVLKGSHAMGRIDHIQVGGQTGADPERTDEAMKVLELVHCEMEPGEALFFHSNLLHRSDQNRSEKPRLVLICCYNAARNDPYKEHHHPRYTKLEKLSDAAVKEMGARVSDSRDFLHSKDDETIDEGAR